GEQRVVRESAGDEREAGDLDGLVLGIVVETERLVEHVVPAQACAEVSDPLAALGRQPELGLLLVPPRPGEGAPHPGDEIAAVVEVPVRDDDRVDVGPAAVERAQAGEHAGAAIEQEPAVAVLDEVAGLRPAGVRPGGRRANDDQAHGPYTAAPMVRKT